MRLRRRVGGLSLAELVVALALASLAILVMVAYFASMYKASVEGHSQASATAVATEVLERLKSDPEFLEAVAGMPPFTVTEPTRDPEVSRTPRRFTVEVEQTLLDTEGRYRDVAVQVRWQEQGRDRLVTLETVILVPEASP